MDDSAKILHQNRTDYSTKKDLGLVVNRQHYSISAPHTSYTVGTSATFEPVIPPPMQIRCNLSRSDFVDGRASYLSFSLTTNHSADVEYSFANGSALNWVEGIQLIGSDGQYLDDLTSTNLWMTVKDRYSKSSGYFSTTGNPDSQGDMKGYNNNVEDDVYICPLGELIPLFNYDKLLPSNIIDGMSILITFASPHVLITKAAGPAVADLTYTVSNVKILFDTYTMDTMMQKIINSSEMVIEFPTYKSQYHTFTTKQSQLPFNYTVSRALRGFAVSTLLSTAVDAEDTEKENILTDWMSSDTAAELDKFQWRVGNKYQPALPVSTIQEAYAQALYVFDKLSNDSGNIQISPSSFEDTQAIWAVNLRRAGMGTPINNNNALTLSLDFEDAFSRITRLFVEYTKRLTIKPISPEMIGNGLRERLSISE